MKTISHILAACAALVVLPWLAGCSTCCAQHSPIRPIDKACLPAGKPVANMPLYRDDIDADYEQIAYVDSAIADKDDPDSITIMLKDLQQKGSAAGADAIIRVKLIANKSKGFINNPNTPFDSVMQGITMTSYFRGIAIKYRTPPNGEPAMLPEPKHPPAKAAKSGKGKKGKKKNTDVGNGSSKGLGGLVGSISNPGAPTVTPPTAY